MSVVIVEFHFVQVTGDSHLSFEHVFKNKASHHKQSGRVFCVVLLLKYNFCLRNK